MKGLCNSLDYEEIREHADEHLTIESFTKLRDKNNELKEENNLLRQEINELQEKVSELVKLLRDD